MPTRTPWFGSPTAWRCKGRPDIPIAGGGGGTGKLTKAEREALVWPYIPSEANTGLLPGWDHTNLVPGPAADANGDIRLTTTDPLQGDGVWRNRIFWGRLWPNNPALEFENCWAAGWHPSFYCDLDGNDNIVPGSAVSGGIAGCIASADPTNNKQFKWNHCLIDPRAWILPGAVGRPGAAVTEFQLNKYLAYSGGIRGGMVHGRFNEIRNVQDGFAPHMPRTTDADTRYIDFSRFYIHDIHYYQGPDFALPEGTHSDGIQSQTGRNVKFYEGYIRGPHNAGATLKQEVSNDILMRCYNWEMYQVIFEDDGSDAGALVNHIYAGDVGRPDAWQNCSFHDMLFVERQAGGKVLSRSTQFASQWVNPRLIRINETRTGWIDLGPAPIVNA